MDDLNSPDIYTPISDVHKILLERRNNQALKNKIIKFFGDKAFSYIGESPRAVLSRSIATPNMELHQFLHCSYQVKLSPIILEYFDKFVSKNKAKYHLCKLFFFHINSDKSSRCIIDTIKVVNFNNEEGKNFKNIRTLYGEKIIDLHHQLLLSRYPYLMDKVFDFSDWFNQTRYCSEYYYLYYLALFIRDGVLFENFLTGDVEENLFFRKNVLPSFKKIEEIFGVRPLICQLLPHSSASNVYWYSYLESFKTNPCLAKYNKKCYNASIWNSTYSKTSSTVRKLYKKLPVF